MNLFEPMLNLLAGPLGDWGLAIIFLSFIVKLVLSPLQYKAVSSAMKSKDDAKKVAEINLKYGDDPEELGKALEREIGGSGYNPLGNVIPLLVQVPVLFFLYQSVVNVHGKPFFDFIPDVGATIISAGSGNAFSYMLLAALYAAVIMYQMRGNKYGIYYAVVLLPFLLFIPAGVILYLLTASLFNLAVNYIARRRHEDACV